MSSSNSIASNENRMVVNVTSLQRLKSRRKLWLKVHLWLGLGLGLFLVIIGLTGSVLVFWKEIDMALNPGLYRTANSAIGHVKPLDEIIAAAENVAPAGWKSAWAQVPGQPDGNYIFGFAYPKISPAPEQAQSLNIAVDPYTAKVSGRRVFYHAWNPLRHSFVGFFFKLHYALFLGEVGGTLVGILAVLFIISVLSGLILWWPLTGKWGRALTIKRRASAERLNHDLHQTGGFYSLIILLAVLMSGVYFNLPDQFRWLVELFSPLTAEAQAPVKSMVASKSLDLALNQASRQYSGGTLNYFTLNADDGLFKACYRDVPELRPYVVAERCLVLNRNEGKLLQVIDAERGSAGDVFMQWQWPLHSGQAFGWTGRIMVFITGLICPLLFVTGVIRWLQKRRVKTAKT